MPFSSNPAFALFSFSPYALVCLPTSRRQRRYGELYSKFDREMYLWEVVSFSHRLTVVVFVLFLSRRAVWMVGALLSFSVAYTVLQFFFWPFVDRNVNRVEASQVRHPPLSTRSLIGAKRVEGEGGVGWGRRGGMWGRRGVVCCCLYEFFAACELSLAHRSLSSNLKLAQFVATFALVFSGVLFYSGELRTSADELAVLVAIAITGTSTILVVCLFVLFFGEGGWSAVCVHIKALLALSTRLRPPLTSPPPCFDHPFHLQSLSAPTSLGRGGGVCGGLWV